MMEIIHDVAPGASQAFHTAFEGQASFAQGIIDLANAGAKVITDDILYFAEPLFQDGIIAQAVDLVKARGISYFSAAGNDGRQAYESPFRGSGQFRDLGAGPEELHDFDPGLGVDTCQQITIPVGGTLGQIFQWDEPFFSVSGAPGSQSDLDIVLTDAACNMGLAGSADVNVGGDPFEVFSFANAGPATTFGMIILQFSGPDPGLMKTVNVGSGSITIDQFDTRAAPPSATLSHAGGSASARPITGIRPRSGRARRSSRRSLRPEAPPSSSIPPGTGSPHPRSASSRPSRRRTAPTRRSSPGVDPEADGFPNFFGTSAAAPHAAGVAALITDLNPSLGPDAIYSVLKTTAVDMDDPAPPGSTPDSTSAPVSG